MSITATLFIVFVLGMAAIVVGLGYRASGKRAAVGTAVALSAWFAYVVTLSHFGVLQRTDTLPPGMIFILGPVVIYLGAALLLTASGIGVRLASAMSLSLLIGLQAFRVIVELFIHRLYKDGVVPKMLTFSDANVDIYIGISAIIVAIGLRQLRRGEAIALVWNVLGLIALANVVARAILTAPGPLNLIHTAPANRMFGTFPFMFIPAFFVPLAVTLHLLAIRAIWARQKTLRA